MSGLLSLALALLRCVLLAAYAVASFVVSLCALALWAVVRGHDSDRVDKR